MMSNNIGAQLRRFVSICQSEADSNSRLTHPLNRAPGEWQHLSELITSLLHTCPPARSAILSFVYPIVGAHLQSITQLQQQQQQMQVDNQTRQERRWLPPPNQPSENFILSILSAAGDVCNQESEVLNDLGQPSFAADVCTFALDLLVPLAPPPHRDVLMPTHCRRHQTSAHPTSRIPKVTSRRRRVNRSKGGLDSTDEMTECEDAGGSSSSSGGSGSSGRNSDSGSRNGSSSDDNESCSESVSEKDQAVIAVDVSLDLRPTGFNGRLLGATWMSSPVVRQLLRIVFSCILGKWSSQACLQSLVASSLPTAYRGRKAQQLAILQQTDPSACQPHWCTNWLLYQAATCAMPRQTIDKLCTRILDVCLRGPPLSLGVPYSPEYHRFWVLSGISNMLFFGPSVESHLASWLRDRLLHSSENHTPKPVFLHVIAPLLLIAPRSSSNNSASNNGEGTSQPPSHRNSPMSKRPAGFQESPNFGPVRPPVPPPPPPHPMQGPRWSFASHTPPGPRPPFCPPQPPLAPHPPPPPPQPSQNISAPPAAAPHRTAFEVASGLFPHDNLPPDSPQLRYLRSLCLSLRSVTLTVLKDFFSMPEVRLRPLLESYLMLIPDQEVELLRDVFVRGLFEAPAECSARWIELLLDLELSTDTSVSVGARSLLKLLCLRTHESIVCRTEVDSEAAGVGNIPFIDCLEGLSRGRSCQEPLFPGGGVLMRKLVTEGCLSAGQLLVLHLHHAHRRSLARALFGNLMLWNLASETANSPSPPKTRCPLLYFFPLLADWESIGGGGGGVNSLRDLLRDCVADVLDALANLPPKSQANALVNVLWLLRREQHLQGDPQLHLRPAMVSLLPRFIALLPCLLGDADLTGLGLALDLLDLVFPTLSSHVRLQFGDCIAVGHRLVHLLVALMTRLDWLGGMQSATLSAFQRAQRLLLDLANTQHDLLRTTALVCLAKAAPHGVLSAKTSRPVVAAHASSCLTDLLGATKPSNLLLANPPSPGPEHISRGGAVRGQLMRRHPLKQQLPAGNSELCSPVPGLWVELTKRLLHTGGDTRADAHVFGLALEDALLPHGMRLPQTSVCAPGSHSAPPSFVGPPTGLGLERTLALLRCFLQDSTTTTPSTNERILWGLLELLLLPPPPPPQKDNNTRGENKASKTAIIPAMRLVLGLLAGLEVSWASPLAPRVPLTPIQADAAVQAELGVFPLVGLPTVARQRARKLAVEYGHRRVDTQSRLYQVTEFLVTRLAHLVSVSRTEGEGEEFAAPLECLLCRQTPRETAICLSDIRRNLRLRAFVDVRGEACAVPAPAAGVVFFTPGLLMALAQSHIVEPGVAEVFRRLLHQLAPMSPQKRITAVFEADDDVVLEDDTDHDRDDGGGGDDDDEPMLTEEGLRQVNVDGEIMVVIEN